ncbi:MAG: hypothetical protein A2286_12005 [Gammaproteobacteria bacterium RIFOXYA12_FULL_61_12]|nr:MAG: hypothetical protein A2286_12005 [Gammaproteobacteria bacterium RIFOXYA12_FULL_61_12]OGT91106.1 MAG: hypothetical protein A2514_09375 [Gammaproteobacteria bacterium RIFOXYD12_FULL_61_37]
MSFAVKEMLLAVLLLWGLMAPAQAGRHALLIGISDYGDPAIRDLEGPRHDVEALRKVLIGGWGASPGNVRVLLDRGATRGAILGEIEQLAGRVTAGDQVLIYFSGHGTSRYDSTSGLPIPHGSGAYIPWDGIIEGTQGQIMANLLIGNRDLRPRLDQLDRTGAEVLVVADSCFSGNAVRSANLSPTRDFPSRQQVLTITSDPALSGKVGEDVRPPPPPYPYRNISYLSAASDLELAMDIAASLLRQAPTLDSQPHGAFTDALLRVLGGERPADADGDGKLSHAELRLATQALLAERGFQHSPQLLPPAESDPRGQRDRALFATRPAAAVPGNGKAPPLRVALGKGTTALEPLVRQESGMQLVTGGTGDVQVAEEDGQWLLLAGAGDPISRIPAGDAGRALYLLRLHQWVQALMWRQGNANPFGLKLDLVPGERGGNFRYGESLSVRMTAARPVWLVLLDIDSNGGILPLYPNKQAEMNSLAADREIAIHNCAREPEGTDYLIALAFTGHPPLLEQLLGKEKLAFDDPALTAWRTLFADGKDGTAAAVTQIRVIKGEGKCPP